MNNWIFQGNSDIFDVDSYLAKEEVLFWPVREKHLAKEMRSGDLVFIWRASGSKGGIAGIVAKGVLTGRPEVMDRDHRAQNFWKLNQPDIELMVPLLVLEKCNEKGRMVRRSSLTGDPIASGIRIMKLQSETNYRIKPDEAERLENLVNKTGKNWDRAESIAGMWAYAQTYDKPVSQVKGSPAAEAAVSIGRAITSITSKIMNFRAIDPRDSRKGLSAAAYIDTEVFNEFFDEEAKTIRIDALNEEYAHLWSKGASQVETEKTYRDFGDAPNDDPDELQKFAAVRLLSEEIYWWHTENNAR